MHHDIYGGERTLNLLHGCHEVAHWPRLFILKKLVCRTYICHYWIALPDYTLIVLHLITSDIGMCVLLAVELSGITDTGYMFLRIDHSNRLILATIKQLIVMSLIEADMIPLHIEKLLARLPIEFFFCSSWPTWAALIIAIFLQAAINTTISAWAMLSMWLLRTGETIHIALANYDLFLPIVDGVDLVLSALSQLAYFSNHDL